MKSALVFLWEYARHYRMQLVGALLTIGLYGMCSTAPAYIIRYIVDGVAQATHIKTIIFACCCFASISIIKSMAMYASGVLMEYVGSSLIRDIRRTLFAHVIRLPTIFFSKHMAGEITSYFISDMLSIQDGINRSIRLGIRSLCEAVCLISVAVIQNPKLAALLALLAPFIAIILRRLKVSLRESAQKNQEALSEIGAHIYEVVSGIREVKTYHAEQFEIERFASKLDHYFSLFKRAAHFISLTPAIIELCAMTAVSLLLLVAFNQVRSGLISPGELASFFAATLLAYQPLKRLVSLFTDLQASVAATTRVQHILMLKHHAEIAHQPCSITIDTGRNNNSLMLHNVTFGYEQARPVIENLNLDVNPGERIGIVGVSGSGKSTLCDLLLGFLSPQAGMITLGQHDLSLLTTSKEHTMIGYVRQTPFLFNDTIAHNVAYGKPDISLQDIQQACVLAGAHQFITQLPQGYETVVGENGNILSGGQRQRITIARALLLKPYILLLDEATSALDAESEGHVVEMIRALPRSITVLAISHRPALMNAMDRVYELRDKHLCLLNQDAWLNPRNMVPSTTSTSPIIEFQDACSPKHSNETINTIT